MAFAEDLSIFFDRAEFAESATMVLPAETAGQEVDVIFDEAYQVEDGMGLGTCVPVATVAISALPEAAADALVNGDAVAIELRGITYNVAQYMPDGNGVAALRLRKD